MATWVRNLTGTAPSATNANLTGTAELDNATAPGDFDPDAVNSVRMQTTWAVTAGSLVDDTHTVHGLYRLTLNGVGTELAAAGVTTPGFLNSGTSSVSDDDTDSSIPTGHTAAEWEGAEMNPRSSDNAWTLFTQDMKADGATVEITALTVTIDYTPTGPAPVYPPFPPHQQTVTRM